MDVKKASLYHHFPGGKPALFMEVADHYTEEAATLLQGALATPGTLRDKLLALAASYAEGTYNSALSKQIYYATRHSTTTGAPRSPTRTCAASSSLSPTSWPGR